MDKSDSTPHQTLYEYYKKQYPKDFHAFQEACSTDKYSKMLDSKCYFVDDLDDTSHSLLKKKHFVYFMVINTAFLMVVHKYFGDKYEEYKVKNKEILFEFGLTNTFIYPWDILRKLKIDFDKELFQNCLGILIGEIFINDNICGIIPRDFMGKLVSDPDLTNEKIIIGKEWAKMCSDEWLAIKID